MGFFKSFLKPFRSFVDKLTPEAVKNVESVVLDTFRNIDLDDFIPEKLKKSARKGQDPLAPPIESEDVTGRVNEAEAAEIARKRLSRVGRFFTGVLGDTSKATTASKKVFS